MRQRHRLLLLLTVRIPPYAVKMKIWTNRVRVSIEKQ
jgi:hypothetical protein